MRTLLKRGLVIVLLLLSVITVQGQVSRLGGKYNVAYQDNYQRVAAGYSHYLEIKNGKLYAAGSNNFGQLGINTISANEAVPKRVGTDSNWVTASAGENFSAAIKADGTLWTWGYNNRGQLGNGNTQNSSIPLKVGTANNWVSVSAGSRHVLAIKADGTLWAWGYNYFGQLGNGTTSGFSEGNPTPTQIGTANNWTYISSGYNHNLALKADGSLWSWGENTLGQVGTGNTSTTGISAPVQIGSSSKWRTISAGGFYSMAINANGTLWTWGDNYYGELGNGATVTQAAPVQIGTNRWKSIDAGRNHAVALKTDGTVWVWGDELGSNSNEPSTPVQKAGLTGIVQITAGEGYTLAVKSNGELFSWGLNAVSQLGKGVLSPVEANATYNGSTAGEVLAVASGHGFNSIALYSDGTLKGWGANDEYQLADGTTENKSAPISIPTAGNDNIAVATGFGHTMALKDNGTLWGWGDNASSGQVGSGSNQNEQAPVAVGTENQWISITTGSHTTAGIKSDGSLWAWGGNHNGEVGNGDISSQSTPFQIGINDTWSAVAMGGSHTIAIKSDGTLWGWGRNYAGESGAGENVDDVLELTQIGTDNDWVALNASSMSSFALKANGTLWGWGAANMGQLGQDLPLPVKITTPTQVGSGNFLQAKLGNWSGAGLLADGTAVAWGNLNMVFGELGMGDSNNYPTPTAIPGHNNIVQIGSGQAHRTILKAVREDVCVVGRNYSGELGSGSDVGSKNTYQCGIAPFENTTPILTVTVATQDNIPSSINTLNGTLQLTALVSPMGSNQSVIWSVFSGSNVGSVSQTGLVTAIANGVVTVRATLATDSTVFGEIVITVTNQVIVPQSLVVTTQNNVPAEIITNAGTLQLVATVNPAGADQSVVWSITEGNEFANINTNGLVTTLANGTLTVRAISVADNTIFGEIVITITNQVIVAESLVITAQNNIPAEITTASGTLQLIATINPTGANQEVVWSITAGNTFATVNANGLVTAVANGTVTVRAVAVDNEAVSDTIDIVINIDSMGVGEVTQNEFVLYPNPTSDIIMIQSQSAIKETVVFNMVGQQVWRGTTSRIDLTAVESGIYIVSIQDENNKIHTQKIIKK